MPHRYGLSLQALPPIRHTPALPTAPPYSLHPQGFFSAWFFPRQPVEYPFSRHAIMHVRCRHHDAHQDSQRIHHNMPFPPFILLFPSYPLSGTLLPYRLTELRLHTRPPSTNQPLAEVVVYGTPRPKFLRQHSPLAARLQLVEQGIPHSTQVYLALPMVVQNFLYTLPLAFG